jgi:SAM-dependent methyltransferase
MEADHGAVPGTVLGTDPGTVPGADPDADPGAVPGEELRWRVTGVRETGWFVESGKRTRADFERVLALSGRRFGDFPRILDFGCGSGRVLLQLRDLGSRVDLRGVDIDPDAIRWTQAHIPWASTSVNRELPPLACEDAAFDLIYCHSVFTHLDRHYQDAWLAELRRVLRPGGTGIFSVSGEHPFAELERIWREAGADPGALRKTLREQGFLHIREDSWRDGPFPDFYHSTFHSPAYVLDHWGKFFDVRAYVVRGALDFQDLVLLERR